MPDDLAEERQEPRVATVDVEQVGEAVDVFLEVVERGGRYIEERLEVPRLVPFPV